MSTSTISTAVTTQQEHGQQQDMVGKDEGNSLSRSTDAGTETMPNTSAGETLTRPQQDQDQKHQQLVLVPVHATMESYMPVQQQQQQQQQPQMQWYPPSQAFAATAVAHHPQMQMVPSQPYMYGMMQQKICKYYLQPHGCKAEEGLAAGNTCGFLHELPREWRCNNCMNTGHRIKDCHVKYCRFFQQGRCSYQQKHGRPCPMIHEMLQQVPYQAPQQHMGTTVANGIQAPIQQQISPEYAPSNPQVHSAVQHAIPMAQQQLHTGTLGITPIPTIIAAAEANAGTSVTVAPFTLTPTTVATVTATISNAAAASAQVSDDVSKTSLASIRREYVKEWRQKRQQHFMESASDVKLDKDGDETTTTTMPPCEAATDTLSTLATATRDNIPPTSPTTGALIANGKSAFSSVISRPNGSLAMTKTMTNGHVHGTSTNGLVMSRVEESRETVLHSTVAKQNQDIVKPVQTPDSGVKTVQVSQDKDVKYIKHAEHVEHAKNTLDTLDTLVLLDNTIYASIGKLSNLTIDTGSWTMKTITVKVPSKYTHLTILPAAPSSSAMLAPLAVGVSQSPSPSPMMASDERKQVNGKIMATAATHQVMTTQMTPLSPTFKSNPALLQRSSSANETGKDIHSGPQLTTVGLVSASRTATPVIELDTTSWQHEPIVHVTSRHADSVISIQTNGQDKKTAASDGENTRAEHSRDADGGDKDEEEEETSETEEEEEEESEHEEEVDVEERDNGQDTDYDKEWQDIQKDRQKALFPPVVASLAPSKHPLHKTVVCRYFARGNCEKSDSECSFIHGSSGKNERKSAVADKQQTYKTSIVVVNKAVQQQQQRDNSVVKTSTTVVDKKTAPVSVESSPLATEADYQCKFWCNVCEVGFHTIVQHNKHDSSEMHKYFTDLKRLNEYTSRVSLAYACFNCGKTDHILKKCPVGFCRRNGNGDCTYGDDCALLHVSYD